MNSNNPNFRKPQKTYLGDGVYASFDSHQITLTAENGIEATDTIYLEYETFENLLAFVAKSMPSVKSSLEKIVK
jgi:hypothetical protein